MKDNRLHIDQSKKRIKGVLNVAHFVNQNHHIAYIPSLDLSGYGDTRAEAEHMLMDIVLNDFFENIIDLSEAQLAHELEKLGWKKRFLHKRQFLSDSYVDKDGMLKNFELPAETKIEQTTVEV